MSVKTVYEMCLNFVFVCIREKASQITFFFSLSVLMKNYDLGLRHTPNMTKNSFMVISCYIESLFN